MLFILMNLCKIFVSLIILFEVHLFIDIIKIEPSGK
jgi:hypothetical protein